MKILITGGNGMLGHQMYLSFKETHDVYATFRQDFSTYEKFGLFDPKKCFGNLSAENISGFEEVISTLKPDAVVNCIGAIKQKDDDKTINEKVNGEFPHKLAAICEEQGCRLIHFSTDCVFSGTKGAYRENDPSEVQDNYGKTKFAGELRDYPHCLTIRASFIGYELDMVSGLFEWFLSQKGNTIKGFTNAIFTGFTTREMCRIVEMILTKHQEMSGLYHVSATPISKFDLLKKIEERMKLGITILPSDDFHCDRSLDSQSFRDATGYVPPSWDEMINELALIKRPY